MSFSAFEKDVEKFFKRSRYCSPAVLKSMWSDISMLVERLHFSVRVCEWGESSQKKLCVYGGLPTGEKHTFMVPIQIWLSSVYPVEPPSVYVVPLDSEKVPSNNKYVDSTGLCYSSVLANWSPQTSTLKKLIVSIAQAFETNPPLYVDRTSPENGSGEGAGKSGAAGSAGAATATAEDGNECVVCFAPRDTVLVPCGHFCVCGACAANMSTCPLCRVAISFRQKLFV